MRRLCGGVFAILLWALLTTFIYAQNSVALLQSVAQYSSDDRRLTTQGTWRNRGVIVSGLDCALSLGRERGSANPRRFLKEFGQIVSDDQTAFYPFSLEAGFRLTDEFQVSGAFYDQLGQSRFRRHSFEFGAEQRMFSGRNAIAVRYRQTVRQNPGEVYLNLRRRPVQAARQSVHHQLFLTTRHLVSSRLKLTTEFVGYDDALRPLGYGTKVKAHIGLRPWPMSLQLTLSRFYEPDDLFVNSRYGALDARDVVFRVNSIWERARVSGFDRLMAGVFFRFADERERVVSRQIFLQRKTFLTGFDVRIDGWNVYQVVIETAAAHLQDHWRRHISLQIERTL